MKYRSKTIVDAVPYDDSMAVGTMTRYCTKEDWIAHVKGDIDNFSTWGISLEDDDVAIEVPYVLSEKGGKILAGDNYMIITELTRTYAMTIDEFNRKFEKC